MSFLEISKVRISGMAATVPARRMDNLNDPLVSDGEKILKNVGIRYRHTATDQQCASDLCFDAAKRLLSDLNWSPSGISCLIFVRQTPDYLLPASSTELQNRLGLPQESFALDVAMGCSGFIYGLSTITALMQSGHFKKGLLLVGDTISRTCSPSDKSTYPLFGDAGVAIALEYDENATAMKFSFHTDGSGKEAIIVPAGGFREPFSAESLQPVEVEDGISRSRAQLALEGMDVFTFGISKAPQSVNELLTHFEIDPEKVDYFAFHQANLFMNEKIRKKLKIEEAKVPYSLEQFGNTSSATIPLTLIANCSDELRSKPLRLIGCGFGVGLSWGSVYLETQPMIISEIGYLDELPS